MQRHSAMKPFYLALGSLFIVLGYVGYVVPGMPGTIFFILALWAFKKSSPRLEDWLLNESFMGPTLRDWEQDRSMRMQTKLLAIGMLWLSILVSAAIAWNRPSAIWLVPSIVLVALGVTVYIWTRKTKSDPQLPV